MGETKILNEMIFDGQTTGNVYESVLVSIAKQIFKRAQDCTGTLEDILNGTDLIIDGVRIDITTNYIRNKPGKIYMLDESYSLGKYLGRVRYALRASNGHKGAGYFKEPVLVIGVEAACGLSLRAGRVFDSICDEFEAKINEIMELGFDLFWDKCDQLGYDF